MKKNLLLSTAGILLLGIYLISCGKEPVPEMPQAATGVSADPQFGDIRSSNQPAQMFSSTTFWSEIDYQMWVGYMWVYLSYDMEIDGKWHIEFEPPLGQYVEYNPDRPVQLRIKPGVTLPALPYYGTYYVYQDASKQRKLGTINFRILKP